MAVDQRQVLIDNLLERYLILLDEYTLLRDSMTHLHAEMRQAVARANFSAERGLRYGRDHHDTRVRHAGRVVVFEPRDDGGDAGATIGWTCRVVERPDDGAGAGNEGAAETPEESGKEENGDRLGKDTGGGKTGNNDECEDDPREESSRRAAAKDSLRSFGLVTPSALREARALAVESVTTVVPRLVATDAEMKAVEIEVRRVRKTRAQAVEEGKERQQQERQQQQGREDKGETLPRPQPSLPEET